MPVAAPSNPDWPIPFRNTTAQRQTQIVDYGGLRLLLPLSQSSDSEVKRLAAHALANLSVNCKPSLNPRMLEASQQTPLQKIAENQQLMAQEGAISMLIELLDTGNELTQRQAAKAIANLGVDGTNDLIYVLVVMCIYSMFLCSGE